MLQPVMDPLMMQLSIVSVGNVQEGLEKSIVELLGLALVGTKLGSIHLPI